MAQDYLLLCNDCFEDECLGRMKEITLDKVMLFFNKHINHNIQFVNENSDEYSDYIENKLSKPAEENKKED